MIKIKTENLSKVILYFFSFLVVYSSGSVITSMVEDNVQRVVARNIILAIALFFSFMSIRRRKNVDILIIAGFVSCTLFLINILNYSNTAFEYLYFLIRFVLFIGVCLYCQKIRIDILSIIYNIIVAIAVVSLLFYVVINIIHLEIPRSYVYLIEENHDTNYFYNYFGFYFYRPFGDAVYRIKDLEIIRLSALFWEPGVYGVFLNFALYRYLYRDNGKSKLKLFTILISIVLTFSTTCWMATVILLAVNISEKRLFKQVRILAYALFGLAALLISVRIFISKYQMMSGNIRVLDFVVGFQIYIENFLTGIGYQNITPFIIRQGWGRGNSNGLITWFFTLGTLGGVLLFLPFIKNYRYSHNKDYIVYIILFVMWNMGEPITIMAFMSMLVAYEYSIMLARRLKI